METVFNNTCCVCSLEVNGPEAALVDPEVLESIQEKLNFQVCLPIYCI
jgi:hypothetical protein